MTDNNAPVVSDSRVVDENLRNGLVMLWQARTYAMDTQSDVWDFALEIETLYESGVTINDLRWLVTKGYAKHGQETSLYGDSHRSFRPCDGLNFTDTTCFVLTDTGAEFAAKVMKKAAAAD